MLLGAPQRRTHLVNRFDELLPATTRRQHRQIIEGVELEGRGPMQDANSCGQLVTVGLMSTTRDPLGFAAEKGARNAITTEA
jgi:hypothetical protein